MTGRQKCESPVGAGLIAGKAERNGCDSRTAPYAPQALRAIDGERKAGEYLSRLHAQQVDPDELALIVAALYGATLRGFCRALEKALGVRHA